MPTEECTYVQKLFDFKMFANLHRFNYRLQTRPQAKGYHLKQRGARLSTQYPGAPLRILLSPSSKIPTVAYIPNSLLATKQRELLSLAIDIHYVTIVVPKKLSRY